MCGNDFSAVALLAAGNSQRPREKRARLVDPESMRGRKVNHSIRNQNEDRK